MIVSRYGVRLVRLREEHLELLRTWRNAEKIARFMEFRQYITPQMQHNWFKSLSAERDFYFMIEYRGKLVGMIHASHVDWQRGRGDAGLFIYEDKYLSTYIPVLASLCMVDLFFGIFKLETLQAKVMKNNPVAADYNMRLGFVPLAGNETEDHQMYALERTRYFETTELLRKKAIAVEGNRFSLCLDMQTEQLLENLQVYRNSPTFDILYEKQK